MPRRLLFRHSDCNSEALFKQLAPTFHASARLEILELQINLQTLHPKLRTLPKLSAMLVPKPYVCIMYRSVHAYMYTCVYIYTYRYMYIYIYINANCVSIRMIRIGTYIYIYIYILCMYIHIHWIHILICIYIWYIYFRIQQYPYTCMHISFDTCTYIYTDIYIYLSTYLHIYCTCICMHTYVFIYPFQLSDSACRIRSVCGHRSCLSKCSYASGQTLTSVPIADFAKLQAMRARNTKYI